MTDPFKIVKNKAIKVLHTATTDYGILALPMEGQQVENYTRVWARDSIMAGLAGIDCDDSIIIEGLKQSLNTLKTYQSEIGVIPSNVSISNPPKVSYGGTAGRVDATLWYIIGALKYLEHTGDDSFRRTHIWHIEKALDICNAWEFNHKHLIYTPLSGNWADEYPIHGYTLYDNCLRLWGLQLYSSVVDGRSSIQTKIKEISSAIRSNFALSEHNKATKYHELLYDRELSKGTIPYFTAGFNPSRYYRMFDAGGNGLALMLGLFSEDESQELSKYLVSVFDKIGINLMPAFWPVIDEKSDLYSDLKSNYAYSFKNKPHHFHNGGIWPIMNGWLAKGLNKNGQSGLVLKMTEAYTNFAHNEEYKFSEYISSDELKPGGKSPLCYSATGALMLINSNT